MGSNSCEQMLYCLKRICDPCKEHVDNKFTPLSERATNEFIPIRDEMTALMTKATEVLANKAYDQTDALLREGAILKGKISTLRKEQMDRIQERDVNVKSFHGVPQCIAGITRIGFLLASSVTRRPYVPD